MLPTTPALSTRSRQPGMLVLPAPRNPSSDDSSGPLSFAAYLSVYHRIVTRLLRFSSSRVLKLVLSRNRPTDSPEDGQHDRKCQCCAPPRDRTEEIVRIGTRTDRAVRCSRWRCSG